MKKSSLLILILSIKALLILLLVVSGQIGLTPDEAQYWCWSKKLAWGYYSKPPGIAWQIWLGTALLGNTELGVRAAALLIGFCLPLAVYRLGSQAGLHPRTSFYAALGMAFCPAGVLASLFATTDGAFILFWSLACAETAAALQSSLTPRYWLIGLFICLGALFKWTALLLWPILFAGMAFFPILRRRQVLTGMAISLAALIPSLIWNIDHEWATFRHVSGQIIGTQEAVAKANPADFILSQAALASPIIFLLAGAGFYSFLKRRRQIPDALLFYGCVSACILLPMSIMALFQKMQGNWAVCALPTLFPVASWYAFERPKAGKKWYRAGLALAALSSCALLAIPLLNNASLAVPYSLNLFRHSMGWNSVDKALAQSGYDPEQHFLFGDHYQVSSILSFYGPRQKRAYFLNLRNRRNNQFSYWPAMHDEQLHKNGFFILVENSPSLHEKPQERITLYQKILKPYFRQVTYKETCPLLSCNDLCLKGAVIFYCEDYNGIEIERVITY